MASQGQIGNLLHHRRRRDSSSNSSISRSSGSRGNRSSRTRSQKGRGRGGRGETEFARQDSQLGLDEVLSNRTGLHESTCNLHRIAIRLKSNSMVKMIGNIDSIQLVYIYRGNTKQNRNIELGEEGGEYDGDYVPHHVAMNEMLHLIPCTASTKFA